MANRKKIVRKGICLPLLLITVILTCVGLVMVLSSSYNSIIIAATRKAREAAFFSSFKTQGLIALIGIVFMLFISRVDYHKWANPRLFISAYLVCIILLFAVFAFPAKHDAHRWIEIPGGLTIQPSEVAKFVGIFYAAFYTGQKKWWYQSFREVLGLLLPIGIIAGMILAEPDLSTTMCFLGSVVIIMFVSGMPLWWGLIGVAAIGALIPLMITIVGYQSRRFDAWLHAWDDPGDVGYQIVQSLYAIGDGGLFGVGLGNSKQKITHLPMSDTDYIFAIICEEFGFVGAIIVVGLYVAFAVFGIKIAMEAYDGFGTYLATGITCMIVVQAFLNMAVATNVLPSTGVTLPFVSKGASSLGVMLLATGVLLSVSSFKPRSAEELSALK